MGEKHSSRNRAEFDQAHGPGHVGEEFTPLDDEKKVYLTAIPAQAVGQGQHRPFRATHLQRLEKNRDSRL